MKILPSKEQLIPGLLLGFLAMFIANKVSAIKNVVG